MKLRRLVVAATLATLPLLGANLPGALGGDGGKCFACPPSPPAPHTGVTP